MIRFTFSIIFLFPFLLVAQSTTKISQNTDKGWKETFYVLKDNREIKHGSYQLKTSTHIITQGFFKNGLKDSLWVYKTYDGLIKNSGMYKNGERIGVWEFYGYNGIIEHTYDYSAKELVYLRDSIYKNTTTVITDNGHVQIKIDRAPIYLEGSGALFEILDLNMNYPNEAKEKGIQGKVWISFQVDKNGVASDFAVESGIGGGCDEEALSVVKMFVGPWLPGMLGGQPVSTFFRYPITFTLR